MKYIKVQGTMNDFILIDETEENRSLSPIQREMWAIKLCDSMTGIGADGVLFVCASTKAHKRMRILNADGSIALMCGNGLRCFSRYAMEALDLCEIQVETEEATYSVKKDPYFDKHLMGYAIYLDNVKYYGQTNEIVQFENKMGNKNTFAYLTVSNPHIVSFVTAKEMTDEYLIPLGQMANGRQDIFSEGMNVNLVQRVNDRAIYVRTYERGVGITKSCGTGMTASVTAYTLANNLFETWIDVFNDGGMIKCCVHVVEGGFAVEFIGNATYMFEGLVVSTLDDPLVFTKDKVYEEEQLNFQSFHQNTRVQLGK